MVFRPKIFLVLFILNIKSYDVSTPNMARDWSIAQESEVLKQFIRKVECWKHIKESANANPKLL